MNLFFTEGRQPMSHCKTTCLGASIAILAITAFVPAVASDGEVALNLDSRDLHSLKIFSGEGFVHIQGVDGSEVIEVVGSIVGGRDSRRFTLERNGDTAVLVAVNTERHAFFAWFGRPSIDVTIRVPSRMMLEVRDGPGEITIAGMKAPVIVNDENDAIEIHDQHGNLSVYDGQGAIKLDGITGQVYVQDGQGELSIQNVVGNVAINDGNGSIVVKNVDGHVDIHDGQGGIAAANISQGVTVNDDRSRQLAMSLAQDRH
jgi:hypothetical protein